MVLHACPHSVRFGRSGLRSDDKPVGRQQRKSGQRYGRQSLRVDHYSERVLRSGQPTLAIHLMDRKPLVLQTDLRNDSLHHLWLQQMSGRNGLQSAPQTRHH